ncbi:magnesium transporter [Geoalkalibacter halelectricus]|uniref:magnesium transporter n=1 Tax=Geoalkalibacter halelectricus TaxID=2847045 RepID=UPI003D19E2AB
MNTSPDILSEITALCASGDAEALRAYCLPLHAADLAAALAEAPPADAATVLGFLDLDSSAEILAHLSPEDQQIISAQLSPEGLARIISRMDADDRVDLMRNLPEERSEKILHLLAQAEREDIRKLGSYREGTAGALMTSDYATLTPELTAQAAINKLRLEAPDKETIYYAYVIEAQRRLLGLVSLKDLILARPDARIENFMHRDLITAKVDDDQEEVARTMAKYDLLAIPVTNGNDALAGIVTFDDAHDVAEEEATEDMHRMGALSHTPPGLGSVNMLEASTWLIVQKRIPWLLVLVFMNIFSGAGIAYFEDTIEAVVALVFFLPLLIDSGGNAGSQSATLMIRALATGRAHLKDWFALLGKEVGVAIILGVGMAVAVSVIGVFRAGPEVAAVVAMTMVCTVLFGSLVGMSLPFILSKFKLDPATASAPLVTSIADIGGVLIYFSIATWFLRDIIVAAA